jgi:hypothetical protein
MSAAKALRRYHYRRIAGAGTLWVGLAFAACDLIAHASALANIVSDMRGMLLGALLVPIVLVSLLIHLQRTDFERCLPVRWEAMQWARLVATWRTSLEMAGPLFVTDFVLITLDPRPHCDVRQIACAVALLVFSPVLSIAVHGPLNSARLRVRSLVTMSLIVVACLSGVACMAAASDSEPFAGYGNIMTIGSLGIAGLAVLSAPIVCRWGSRCEQSNELIARHASSQRSPAGSLVSRFFGWMPAKPRWFLLSLVHHAAFSITVFSAVLALIYCERESWRDAFMMTFLLVAWDLLSTALFYRIQTTGLIDRRTAYTWTIAIPLTVGFILAAITYANDQRVQTVFTLTLLLSLIIMPIVGLGERSAPRPSSVITRLITPQSLMWISPLMVFSAIRISDWNPIATIQLLDKTSFLAACLLLTAAVLSATALGRRLSRKIETDPADPETFLQAVL